jgi:hypothetical protein
MPPQPRRWEYRILEDILHLSYIFSDRQHCRSQRLCSLSRYLNCVRETVKETCFKRTPSQAEVLRTMQLDASSVTRRRRIRDEYQAFIGAIPEIYEDHGPPLAKSQLLKAVRADAKESNIVSP